MSWGSSVLAVVSATPPRAYRVATAAREPTGQRSRRENSPPVDFELPDGSLAGELHELVSVEGGQVFIARAPGATPTPLELDRPVVTELGGVTFRVELSPRARALPRALLGDDALAPLGFLGLSLATFGSLMAVLAYSMPPLGLVDEGEPNLERRYVLQQYLAAAAERERRREPEPEPTPSELPRAGGESGARAAGAAGTLGVLRPRQKEGHLAVAGGRADAPRTLSKSELVASAREFGMVGLLRTLELEALANPAHTFARDPALGPDAMSAHGNLWSAEIGETAGSGGLTLDGAGYGGGALYGDAATLGIGQDGLGGMGHCRPPSPCSFGPGGVGVRGGSLADGKHRPSAPSVRMTDPTVSGRLPPEVIRRTVRQNFGRFRLCYEQALGRNPSLEGRVTVRFVIGRDGGVMSARSSSDLADAAVGRCVETAFSGLSFPAPEAGSVSVSYPLVFSRE